MSRIKNHRRLAGFIQQLSALLDRYPRHDEAEILQHSAPLLAELVREDDWLDDEFAQPHPQHYQQYLLHMDSAQRFSVVSFVWGPGQRTPVHDHRVWGLIGMLRGAEISQSFIRDQYGLTPSQPPVQLTPGEVETLSPLAGDIHQVSNAFNDRVSVSIHVYGANIGQVTRATFRPDGSEQTFISGYANRYLPNIWGLSADE